jgi:hypothetical protein
VDYTSTVNALPTALPADSAYRAPPLAPGFADQPQQLAAAEDSASRSNRVVGSSSPQTTVPFDIVGAKTLCDLGDLGGSSSPNTLHVRMLSSIQSRHRDFADIVEPRRFWGCDAAAYCPDENASGMNVTNPWVSSWSVRSFIR